jgi:competence protein ComEA
MACFCPSCEEMDFASKGAKSLGIIKVDLAGAVKNPGIYQLEIGERVADLIDQAGGFSDDVSKEFLAKELNLASELENQAKLYIPYEGETAAAAESGDSPQSNAGDGASDSGKISINNSSQSELETLSGVGEKRAEDIVTNRPYSQLTDLVGKNVLSQSLFDDLKKQLTL